MRVGILGATGPAGSALAARLASSGVDVIVGSRATDRAEAVCERLRGDWPDRTLALEAADNLGAAAGDLVVVATPWDAAPTTAASVGEALGGKVVISMANALARIGREFHALVPPRGSVAAAVQAAVPAALVAGAFHHLPAHLLADLSAELVGDVLVCSDHREATAATMELVGKVAGLRALDAGPLASAAPIEAFTAVLLQLNVRYKTTTALRITNIAE